MSGGDRRTIVWTPPETARELGALPIRLQTPTGDTVARGLSGMQFDVPQGRFYLSVTLPDGTEIIGDRLARIDADCEVSLPSLKREFRDSLPSWPVVELTSDHDDAVSGLTTRIWRGDWMTAGGCDDVRMQDAEELLVPPGGLLLAASGAPDQILLIERGGIVRAHVVPWDRSLHQFDCEPAGVRVSASDGAFSPAFSSPVARDADSLLAFADVGRLDDALLLARAAVLKGPEDRLRSLLHGLIAVYVMLRANDHAGLEEHSEQILALERRCPDVLIQRIEVLARLGRHGEAVQLLAEPRGTGCPWFRSGMSYWLERLKFYLDVDAGAADFRLDTDTRTKFERQRDTLASHCSRMDLERLFTVFLMPRAETDQER